ncbi:MAG: DUF4469 domain-containing protein [Paludibacter sp.]|nr:DUF4469 domain-containing protein [Paludibacter sp.]
MSKDHQQIKALLYPNPMKNAGGTYMARTSAYGTLGIKEICQSKGSKRGSLNNPENMEYYVHLFFEEMAELLTAGYNINTGYFKAAAKINGTFNSSNDEFDSIRHQVNFKFSQGITMRKIAAETKAEILHLLPFNFVICEVTDNFTKSVNELLTPGQNLIIDGIKIKIVGEDPSVGIYFINVSTNAQTKVSANEIALNQNNKLIIVIPLLEKGEYRLKVVTQYSANSVQLVKPRSCSLVQTLKVL